MTTNPPAENAPGGSEPPGAAPGYPVGYGKPPVHSQVKPGQVLNPKGRPKGRRNTKTVFNEMNMAPIRFRDGNRTRSLSKRDFILRRIIDGAAAGNDKMLSKYLALQAKYEDREEPANQVPLTADDEALVAQFLERHGNEVEPTPSPESNQKPQAANGTLPNKEKKS
jgi:hypothetical protein